MAFDYNNYNEIEYLEATGSQYITTTINSNTIGRVEASVKWASTSRQCMLGCWTGRNSLNYHIYIDDNGKVGLDITGVNTSSTSISANTTDYHTYDVNYIDGYFKYDGTSVLTFSGFPSVNRDVWIFCSNDSADGAYIKSSARLKFLKIYNQSGTLTHHFIPARRRVDDVLGLYEIVNGTFYTSANGTFNGGPLVTPSFDDKNYNELTYIETDGNQYINTGYNAQDVGRVRTRARFKSTSRQMLLAAWRNSDPANAYLVSIGYNKDLGFWISGTTPSVYSNTFIINTTDYYDYDLNMNSGYLSINGTTATTLTGYCGVNRTLYLFASNDQSSGVYLKTSAYLCYMEIYDKNGDLAHNFIPARRRSDGTVGVYDTIYGRLYTNNGSGSFTGGPQVTPKFDNDYYYPLEYLETDGTAFINTHYKYNSHNLKFDIDLSIPSLPSGYRTILGMYTSSSKGSPFTIWTLGGNNYLFNDVLNIHYPYNFDGTRQNFIFESQSVSGSSYDLYLFKAYAQSGNVYGGISGTKIYTCQLYDESVLVGDYVPAKRKSDNVLGMYDTVMGVFLPNAGGGSFTGGSEIQFTITTAVSPANSGTVTGGGTYYKFETVSLTATAGTGFSFSKWSDDEDDNPRTISVLSNATYTALFNTVANCRFKVNGAWKYATMYKKVNGQWVTGQIRIKVNGAWKSI